MSLNMLGVIKIKNIKIFKFKTNSKSAFVVGLLNGLMPCGPLQAMQLYALQTGSFIKGSLSMFLFGLGTVPLMLTAGFILNYVDGRKKLIINKISSVLILILSFAMLNRGLSAININISNIYNNYGEFEKAVVKKDYQEVRINLDYDSYKDIIVQKNIPVKLIIHASKEKLTGCNNEIQINKFNIKKHLEVGDNVILFTPKKEETINYTCFMNMIKNKIKVIDNKNYFVKGEVICQRLF